MLRGTHKPKIAWLANTERVAVRWSLATAFPCIKASTAVWNSAFTRNKLVLFFARVKPSLTMSAVGEFLKEDRRLVADSHFAKIAVLRDKHHVLHDERSQSLSAVQVRTLAETAVRASDAHIMGKN